jgi:hypothetical protein
MRTMITIYFLAGGGIYLSLTNLWSSYRHLLLSWWPQRIDLTVSIGDEEITLEDLTQHQSDQLLDAPSRWVKGYSVIVKYRPRKMLQ